MFLFSLKTKMSLAVSLLVIVLMVAFAFLIINHFDKRFKETIATQQYALLSEIARDIDETIKEKQRAIISVAKIFPRKAAKDPVLAQRFLVNRPTLQALFDNGIFLFSPSGRMIAEFPDQHRQGNDFSYREYFRKTIETAKPYISNPYVSSQPHRHPAVMLTVPVFDNNGEIIAVLAGSMDLTKDNFLGEHSQVKIGKSGYIYIFNTDRTIIMHPDPRRILQRAEPAGGNRLFDKAIAGFDGTEETVNSRGLHTLTSVKHIKPMNWILAANYPLTEAYAPIREATRYSIILVAAGVVLSMLIVWLTMKVFTAPLLTLTRHIKRVSEHVEAEQEIHIDSADEIGELAMAYNAMMRRLDSKKEELRMLSRAVEQSASLVVITNRNGDIDYVNPKFCEMSGYTPEELIGQNPCLLKSGDQPTEVYRQLWETIIAGGEWQGEFHNRKKNGELFWTIATISPIKNERGGITHFISVQEDITERKKAEEAIREAARRQQAILDNIPDIAWLKDRDYRYIAVNEAFGRACGMRPCELVGKTDYDIWQSEMAASYRDDDREVMNSGLRKCLEEFLDITGGKRIHVETIKTPIFNNQGEVIGTAGISRDITVRKVVEAQLRHVSTHDMLTGLYNRSFFEEEMGRLARGRQFPVSIISVDVDGLKHVNDTLGHEAGDRLLRAVAQVLLAAFRAEDMLARIGGDEFAVLLPSTDENAAGEAVKRIRKCRDDANKANKEFSVSISLGAATAEKEGELYCALKLSDERMYEEKFAKKGTR